MCTDLDQLLAFYCGPTLAGIKAGSLVSCCWERFPDLETQITSYANAFQPMGVRFELLYTRPQAALLLVFRPELLRQHLTQPLCQKLLVHAGYPASTDPDALLPHLRDRLARGKGNFPHEIGLFLGYPPEDVQGFQIHHGRDFKLCGQWKVYSDVERAQTLFHRYASCRNALCRRLASGDTVTKVFRLAG